jgi:hypothetical protein
MFEYVVLGCLLGGFLSSFIFVYSVTKSNIEAYERQLDAANVKLNEAQGLINDLTDKLMSRNYESYASMQTALSSPSVPPKNSWDFKDTEGEYIAEVEDK